jgi:hypothetical protein
MPDAEKLHLPANCGAGGSRDRRQEQGSSFFTFALQWVRARGQTGGSGVTIKMPGTITCRNGVQEGQGAYRFLLGRRRFPDRMTGLEEIP